VTDRPPTRVRVTGPSRRAPGPPLSPRRRHIDAETRLGEIYLSSLLREQLRLAGLSLLALGVGVAGLPLLFWLVPGLAEVRLWGLPLPWLLLGVAVYPYLVLIGWRYIRAAERNEEDFADLVETVEQP
jgi:hypothetical protein